MARMKSDPVDTGVSPSGEEFKELRGPKSVFPDGTPEKLAPEALGKELGSDAPGEHKENYFTLRERFIAEENDKLNAKYRKERQKLRDEGRTTELPSAKAEEYEEANKKGVQRAKAFFKSGENKRKEGDPGYVAPVKAA